MARFYAEIQGMRGPATRMGSEKSGIWGHIRGWHVGAKVVIAVDKDGNDVVQVYKTRGSSGYGPSKLIAEFREGE